MSKLEFDQFAKFGLVVVENAISMHINIMIVASILEFVAYGA